MRVAALLIVLYFVSSIAFAEGFFGLGGAPDPSTAAEGAAKAADAAAAATEKSISNSMGLIDANKVSDGSRSAKDIAKSKIEIHGGAITGYEGFDIQAKDLRKVKAGIDKQKKDCEKACNDAIKTAQTAVDTIKTCEAENSDKKEGEKKDCGNLAAAEAALKKAKDALKKCQDTHDKLMEIVESMAVEADKASAQAKKVRDASQGFGGSSGGGGGGGDKKPKPGEVTIECLKGVAYLNPACDDFFKKYCMTTPDEAVCANWAGHYCGFDFAAGSQRPHKEEVSCIIGTPYYFCNGQFKEERKNCQSCKDLKTIIDTKKQPYYSTEQLVANRETCPDDPLLKQPEVIERLNIYDNATPSTSLQNQSLDPSRYNYRK